MVTAPSSYCGLATPSQVQKSGRGEKAMSKEEGAIIYESTLGSAD